MSKIRSLLPTQKKEVQKNLTFPILSFSSHQLIFFWWNDDDAAEAEYYARRGGMIAGILFAIAVPLSCIMYYCRRRVVAKRKDQHDFGYEMKTRQPQEKKSPTKMYDEVEIIPSPKASPKMETQT